jgi:phosphate transport system substrate-binding protein
MKHLKTYIALLLLLVSIACMKKADEMTGPTMGKLEILADESLRDIIQQEEEIFERTYEHAQLNITYVSEYDLFQKFLTDSVDAVMTTRALTAEEIKSLQDKVVPRVYPFATSAIALITNKNSADTTYTYETMVSMFADQKSGNVFVIENARSGITQEVLKWIHQPALPAHFYALNSKKEVLDYVKTHDHAIGLVDYSDISDSDNPYTNEVLKSINLLAVSRPVDSIQYGYNKPFQYNLQDRKYPFTRDLYFISKTGKSDVGTGFASFICGEIGQKIILKAGLLPKFQTERYLEINETSDIKVVK